MKFFQWPWLERLSTLLEIPDPDRPQLLRRIRMMERDILLPVKMATVPVLVYFLYFPHPVDDPASTREVAMKAIQYFFYIYVAVNSVAAVPLLAMRRLPLALIQWGVFTISLVDGLFLAALTLATGGYDSILFWLYLGLIVRNAISIPPGVSQLILNFSISMCYVLAGVLDVTISQSELGNLDIGTRHALGVPTEENPTEPFLVRLVMLWLMTICCYGVQVLLERQRLALEEAQEFAVREGQLRSAGRLAAEIAHQIKNPLAIITNAAFSLQRALAAGKNDTAQQIQIIQEEVERSDRIVTQLMGYAQLTEGRVEKLNVIEELDRAIEQVFPAAAQYEVRVHRDYAPNLPPLLMQRSHLSAVLVNLLQNAREALNGGGNVYVSAEGRRDHFIKLTIRDDGPGISSEQSEKIFEAYFTTKEKGTGLGLAIVKHNVELYGGTVRVESELGKGSRFVLLFPARALIELAKDD